MGRLDCNCCRFVESGQARQTKAVVRVPKWRTIPLSRKVLDDGAFEASPTTTLALDGRSFLGRPWRPATGKRVLKRLDFSAGPRASSLSPRCFCAVHPCFLLRHRNDGQPHQDQDGARPRGMEDHVTARDPPRAQSSVRPRPPLHPPELMSRGKARSRRYARTKGEPF